MYNSCQNETRGNFRRQRVIPEKCPHCGHLWPSRRAADAGSLSCLLVNNPRVFPSNRGYSAPESVLGRDALCPYYRRGVGVGCAYILDAVTEVPPWPTSSQLFLAHLPPCFGSPARPPSAERNGAENTGKNVYLPPLQNRPQKAPKTGCEIFSAGCLFTRPRKIAHRGSRWRTRRLDAVFLTQKQAHLHLPPAQTCTPC